jgi:hypothetical protein
MPHVLNINSPINAPDDKPPLPRPSGVASRNDDHPGWIRQRQSRRPGAHGRTYSDRAVPSKPCRRRQRPPTRLPRTVGCAGLCMTKVRRIATASIAAIPIGIVIELGLGLGLGISTNLHRYNATLRQAIDVALHSVFMPYSIKDWIIWAALVLIAFDVRETATTIARKA